MQIARLTSMTLVLQECSFEGCVRVHGSHVLELRLSSLLLTEHCSLLQVRVLALLLFGTEALAGTNLVVDDLRVDLAANFICHQLDLPICGVYVSDELTLSKAAGPPLLRGLVSIPHLILGVLL